MYVHKQDGDDKGNNVDNEEQEGIESVAIMNAQENADERVVQKDVIVKENTSKPKKRKRKLLKVLHVNVATYNNAYH